MDLPKAAQGVSVTVWWPESTGLDFCKEGGINVIFYLYYYYYYLVCILFFISFDLFAIFQRFYLLSVWNIVYFIFNPQ